ncbi:hypothetical protein EB796_006831 [Bugula neritina]|uniref:Uncharacterized protein n=1 Tax=Bugula neritina TaxID=10212 RepID=A0A7J7K9H6_BUGNE|nr:hypothetical protein EB796_006831 [Bugula neritina]
MLRSLDILPYGAPQKSDMNSLALVVQRFSSVGAGAVTCQQKGDKISLNLPPGYSIKRTSLSLLYPKDKLNSTVLPQLQPNSLQTYKISSVDL